MIAQVDVRYIHFKLNENSQKLQSDHVNLKRHYTYLFRTPYT